jgi:hypothetical protein
MLSRHRHDQFLHQRDLLVIVRIKRGREPVGYYGLQSAGAKPVCNARRVLKYLGQKRFVIAPSGRSCFCDGCARSGGRSSIARRVRGRCSRPGNRVLRIPPLLQCRFQPSYSLRQVRRFKVRNSFAAGGLILTYPCARYKRPGQASERVGFP